MTALDSKLAAPEGLTQMGNHSVSVVRAGFGLLVALVCLGIPYTASAIQITLECDLLRTDPKGEEHSIQGKYLINLEVRKYTVYFDIGNGWTPKFSAASINEINNRQIILANDSGSYVSIDRFSGEYYAKGKSSKEKGSIWRGTCSRTDSDDGDSNERLF